LRRALIALVVIVPALVLIGWLISAQLPRWTAPQANWFAPNTLGVCSAVDSLKLYDASRADVGGIGRDAALVEAAQATAQHYTGQIAPDTGISIKVSPAVGVQATLPGDQRRGYYLVIMPLSADALPKVAIVYVDAQTGDIKALITAIDDPAANCEFDVKAALLAAVKSPPLLLLVAYGVLVVVGLVAGWLLRRRGIH
jgi:hypothetical protein